MHVFVADIHIRPGISYDAQRFITWLTAIKDQASKIFILGDLFDYWYTGLESRTFDVLEALDSPKIRIMTGNRDFLLKNAHIKNIHLIQAEEQVISLYGKNVLIAHGHTLTNADTGFKILHRYGWPALASIDRYLPVVFKDIFARFLVKSSSNIRLSNTFIARDIASKHGVDTVICGHLHNEQMYPGLIVLPAFFDTGRWLAWNTNGPRFVDMDYGCCRTE